MIHGQCILYYSNECTVPNCINCSYDGICFECQ
jgi:hypothetical protein